MSTPSGLFMNWVNVTITPASGTAITLTKVVGIDIMKSSTQQPFYGDNALFPVGLRNVQAQRGCKIASGDLGTLNTIPTGAVCTVVATLCDPYNGETAGGGAKVHTWNNAVLQDSGGSGPNNNYAGGAATFMCFASDGVTDPYTVVAA